MTPSTVRPASESTWGGGSSAAASRCTAPSDTAHTSQRSCVMTRSGASRRSSAASTAITARPASRSRRTSASMAAPGRLGSISVEVTRGRCWTEAGWSHSWEMATSDPAPPRAATISVAPGSSVTTRISARSGGGDDSSAKSSRPMKGASSVRKSCVSSIGDECPAARGPRPATSSPAPGRGSRSTTRPPWRRRAGAGSRPALKAAAPNSAALTSASATYSTRRSGSASAAWSGRGWRRPPRQNMSIPEHERRMNDAGADRG